MRSTRHGNPFSFCQTWGQAVFFRSEAGSSYLSQYGENGGGPGRIRANPSLRIRKTNPRPKKDAMDRFLSDGDEEEKAVCGTCGAEVQEGVIRCPNGHELDWPDQSEETKENPQEVEEESLLEKAAKMDNETLARFIEERQRDIDSMMR